MNDALKFSVVIPLYEKASFIEASLNAALAQNHPPVEVIVVDDGSRDNGPELVARHPDPRVRLLRQTNSGPGAARNAGVRQAQTPWVAFLDADDLWHPDHLSVHADAIRVHPEAGLVGSKLRRSTSPEQDITALSPRIGRSRVVDYISEVACIIGTGETDGELLITSTISVRRDLLLAVGGFGDAYPGEDTAMWLRLALEAPVVATDARTSVYQVGTGGIMDSRNDWSPARILSHPLRSAIMEALEEPRNVVHHDALRAYLTAVDSNAIRGALYHERAQEARALAEVFGPDVVARLGKPRHLLRLPPALATFLVRAFKVARRFQSKTTGIGR